ncbi:MAG: HIT domain-containing protein [Candidatus Dormibacteraeota bacterium]|nr:HIT domain-containing protein [Candidatus Dormibacteraeota bacterium]
METLWAPWRMTYIDRVNGPSDDDCFLCDAGRPELGDGDLVVHRSGSAVALLNRFPYNPGHLLVAPRSHGGDLATLAPEELVDVGRELQLATAVLRGALGCDGFNGGWNQGRVAGAGVDGHLHFHLVPRWAGDTNFMTVLADVKVIPEHLEATRDKLRRAFMEAGHPT